MRSEEAQATGGRGTWRAMRTYVTLNCTFFAQGYFGNQTRQTPTTPPTMTTHWNTRTTVFSLHSVATEAVSAISA